MGQTTCIVNYTHSIREKIVAHSCRIYSTWDLSHSLYNSVTVSIQPASYVGFGNR